MIGTQAAAKQIATTLNAAAAVTALVSTRIRENLGEAGLAFPYITFSYQGAGSGTGQSSGDRRAIGSNGRLMSRLVWLVKAVGDADATGAEDFKGADAVCDALDAALEDAQGTVTVGATSYRVTVIGREQPVRYLELAEGVRYAHVGGLYLLMIDEA